MFSSFRQCDWELGTVCLVVCNSMFGNLDIMSGNWGQCVWELGAVCLVVSDSTFGNLGQYVWLFGTYCNWFRLILLSSVTCFKHYLFVASINKISKKEKLNDIHLYHTWFLESEFND